MKHHYFRNLNRGFSRHFMYIYLEPVCPLFWWFNPPKQGLFQSKQGSFGFQVYIYIYPVRFVFVEKRVTAYSRDWLEETCTGRGSARGWHLAAVKGRWGSLVLVEVTSPMSVVHRRSNR